MFGLNMATEYERLVVFSVTGRYIGLRGPGLVFVNPFRARVVSRIDLRELVRDIPNQECITKDNVSVTINPIVFYKIADPEKTVLSVQNAEMAILSLARTTLRAVIGEMDLASVTAERERIATNLRRRLSQEAERWGVDITTVEIADLKLDPEVEKAMAARKAAIEAAEAQRRSAILRAQGEKEAAESERDAMLTRAEAEKQAAIKKAEGEREAQRLHGEGIKEYYSKLTELGDKAELALRFEQVAALKKFAESESAKLVIPLEMSRISTTDIRWMEDTFPKKKE